MTDNIFTSPHGVLDVPIATLTAFVFRDFLSRGDNVALIDAPTSRTVSYYKLHNDVRAVGAGLAIRGFRAREVLCVFASNCIEYVYSYFGTMAIGGVVTTCNPSYTPRELAFQLNDSRSKCLVCGPNELDTVRAAIINEGATTVKTVFVIPSVSPTSITGPFPTFDRITNGKNINVEVVSFYTLLDNDGSDFPAVELPVKDDPAILPYSSGTMGLNKGVMLTNYNLVANLVQSCAVISLTPADTLLCLLPLYHIYAQMMIITQGLAVGARVVLMPKFEPQPFLDAIHKYQLTILHLVPPLIVFLTKSPLVQPEKFASVHTILVGAAPLGQEVSEACQKRLRIRHMRQGYGMTETSPLTHITPPGEVKHGSVGLLIPNTELKVVDTETGAIKGVGEQGEWWIKGPQVMKGYLNNPQATSAAIVGPNDRDRWLRTGDVGYVDEGGWFFIVDRVKELIKVKGLQVAPAELEALLLTHPQISDCAVIPIPDEQAGELPKAFIVKSAVNASIEAKDVAAYLNPKVAHFKQLRVENVQFIDAIPKSPAGKILRRVLRDREALARSALVTELKTASSRATVVPPSSPSSDSKRPATNVASPSSSPLPSPSSSPSSSVSAVKPSTVAASSAGAAHRDALKRLVSFWANGEGRDKFNKAMQYGGRMLAYLYLTRDANSDIGAKAKAIYILFRDMRKLDRLFKGLNELDKARDIMVQSKPVNVVSIIGKLGWAAYWTGDNLGLAAMCKLIAPNDEFNRVACIGWFVGLLVVLQQDIATIRGTYNEEKQLLKQRDTATGSDRVSAIIETSRRSLALRNQRMTCYVNIVKNSADLIVAAQGFKLPDKVMGAPINDGVIGALGLFSSCVALATVIRSL